MEQKQIERLEALKAEKEEVMAEKREKMQKKWDKIEKLYYDQYEEEIKRINNLNCKLKEKAIKIAAVKEEMQERVNERVANNEKKLRFANYMLDRKYEEEERERNVLMAKIEARLCKVAF